MSSPSESRNDQCIGNLCVDKIQSPRIRDLCVDKTQSAQICNLCVEKNPRPRRARTNSGRAQLLIGKTIIGRCSNNFLLAKRPIIVFPIRKTPVQILDKKTGFHKNKKNGTRYKTDTGWFLCRTGSGQTETSPTLPSRRLLATSSTRKKSLKTPR